MTASTPCLRPLDHEDHLLTALLVRCAAGDQTALAQFYVLTSPRIYPLVRRHTHSAAVADDAMVAVYKKVWRRAAEFAGIERTALAWTVGIVFES